MSSAPNICIKIQSPVRLWSTAIRANYLHRNLDTEVFSERSMEWTNGAYVVVSSVVKRSCSKKVECREKDDRDAEIMEYGQARHVLWRAWGSSKFRCHAQD